MTVWFTADLHLGHTNIIRYSARPFVDAAAMNRALIDRWNEVVGDDDDVWMLGDFAMGKIDETLPLVAQLRGRKVLLTGNHDRCWADHGRRAEGWAERYLEAGFAEVLHGQINLDVSGTNVVASHFPYRGDSHDHDRYVQQRPMDKGRWLLHGHVHERWQQRGRMINVGVDAWDYRPVAVATIRELISAGPNEREAGSR
jgi:calcineurin-like phosphoesterase family protein